MGVERTKDTGDPFMVAQIVRASDPICSLVVPVAEVVADPGKVIGIGTLHLLLVVVTVAPVMVFPSAEY